MVATKMPFTLLLSSPIYSTSALVLLAVLTCLLLVLHHQRASPRGRAHRGESATPPRSVSPEKNKKYDGRRKSLTSIVTNLLLPLPSAGGRRESTTDTPSSGTELPITNRTPSEIAAFGEFPDYAALSGVPLPKPYSNFDIARALPRPYRPIRWAYHQTMSFKKLEPDWWLELESTYVTRISQRRSLYLEHGADVLTMLPGSEPACKELMEMALQFLVTRYPYYFSLSTSSSSSSSPYIFTNRILNTTTTITGHPQPLEILLDNIPEDFCLALRNPLTGAYEFRAGVVCSSLGWNVSTKIGKTLAEIHAPIPDYAEKMSMSMDRYFTKLPTSTPIQRGSWGLEFQQPLYMPPGHPHAEHRLSQSPSLQLSDINLRVDWQTLRRIPLSGAIIFNFKALFTPITEFRDELGVPGLIAKVCREGKKELMQYKGTWHVEHVAVPALERWSRDQQQQQQQQQQAEKVGADKEDGDDDGEEEEEEEEEEEVKEGGEGWEIQTLNEYPFYGGWREKWIQQQGFAPE